MKKIMLAVCLLWAGVSLAVAQVSLSFNPDKGAKYIYNYDFVQDIRQNVMGQDINMQQKMQIVYDMDVLSKTNNETKVGYTYKEIVFEMSSAMLNMKYDSKNPVSASPMDEMMGKVLGAMLNEQFEAVVLPDGSVKSVTGMEKILEKMNASLGSNPQAAMVTESIKQQFSNEAMKSTFEQSLKIYPKGPVKANDSWEVNQSIGNMMGAMDIASTYQLKSVKAKEALVEVTSSLAVMDGQLEGTQKGSITLNLKDGMISTSEVKQEMAGQVSANGMEVKLSIDGVYKATITKL